MAKTKVKYFDYREFVNKVLEDCKLGSMPEQVKVELEDAVERRLGERITATIINTFGERELRLLEKVLVDHPELDEVDALTVVSSNIPGLQEKLGKAIQDLYDELTYEASSIQQSMDMRAVAEASKL